MLQQIQIFLTIEKDTYFHITLYFYKHGKIM